MTRDPALALARPLIVHRFGRFTHKQDPLLIARVVAFKQGKRIEGV